MPSWYWFHCSSCDWRQQRYRNLKRCPVCGADAVREEPLSEAEELRELVPDPELLRYFANVIDLAMGGDTARQAVEQARELADRIEVYTGQEQGKGKGK
ncbi:MAG TPA: hypothetical protein VM223_03695 [Planctomycetota bacterium]|nr:hypothetical protein [Planctomycetota bacterium]